MTRTVDRTPVFRQPEESRSTALATAEAPDLMGALRDAQLRVHASDIVSTDILSWLRVLDDEDRGDFLRDLFAALSASPEELMLTLREWGDTVASLSDPVRREILLSGSRHADYVEVERPEQLTGAYRPYGPGRRPGGRPRERPRYRVLVHRRMMSLWEALPTRVGLESAQQFYDHVSHSPGSPPTVGRTSLLRGKAGRPTDEGFSRTYHYEISGAGRINYQFHDAYTGGAFGDPHRVVRIMTIDLGSH